jgi:hypothetical protein
MFQKATNTKFGPPFSFFFLHSTKLMRKRVGFLELVLVDVALLLRDFCPCVKACGIWGFGAPVSVDIKTLPDGCLNLAPMM